MEVRSRFHRTVAVLVRGKRPGEGLTSGDVHDVYIWKCAAIEMLHICFRDHFPTDSCTGVTSQAGFDKVFRVVNALCYASGFCSYFGSYWGF